LNNENFMKKLVGHQHVKDILQRLIEKDKLPHALLFYGAEGAGKEAAGVELGKILLCQEDEPPCNACDSCRRYDKFEHPDFFFLFPIKDPKKDYKRGEWEAAMNDDEMKEYLKQLKAKSKDIYYRVEYKGASDILIGQVRNLIQKSSLTSYQGGNRFALISPADRMNRESQNSLLKLLEEPPDDFYICLVTSRLESLLPTVVSRCQPIYFPPVTKEQIIEGLEVNYYADVDKAEIAADRADGSMNRALDILKRGDPCRLEAVDEFLMAVVRNDIPKIFELVSKYDKMRDRPYLVRLLLNIDHWLKDVMLMESGLEPYYNRDLKERIELFRKNIKYEDLTELRRSILSSVDLLKKNVYISLIFSNLANRLMKGLIWDH